MTDQSHEIIAQVVRIVDTSLDVAAGDVSAVKEMGAAWADLVRVLIAMEAK